MVSISLEDNKGKDQQCLILPDQLQCTCVWKYHLRDAFIQLVVKRIIRGDVRVCVLPLERRPPFIQLWTTERRI